MTRRFVAYYRVSTHEQGRSGLGLEAQRAAVQQLVRDRGGELLQEFTEVETGKGAAALSKRPQLRAALAAARKGRAELLIAKLDRLARNVHFISGLMEAGVPFVAADMPSADRFQLHLFAALAEKEAELISERTKAGLAAARARGVILGRYGHVLARRNRDAAAERVADLGPELESLLNSGLSVRAMADELNRKGIPSPGGARWHSTSVHRAVSRMRLAAQG